MTDPTAVFRFLDTHKEHGTQPHNRYFINLVLTEFADVDESEAEQLVREWVEPYRMPPVSFSMPQELVDKVNEKCRNSRPKITRSDVTRELLQMWLDGKVDPYRNNT
jgi:hypothetical protein